MSEVQSWENWLIYNQIWLHSLIFWKTGQASRNSTVILFYTFYVKNCTHSKTIQHLHLILPVSCSQFSYKVVQQSFLFFMELKPRPFSSFWSSYSPPKVLLQCLQGREKLGHGSVKQHTAIFLKPRNINIYLSRWKNNSQYRNVFIMLSDSYSLQQLQLKIVFLVFSTVMMKF